MDTEDALRAVEMIRPRRVVPMHFNTFPGIEADPRAFLSALPGWVEGVRLEPGETIEF